MPCFGELSERGPWDFRHLRICNGTAIVHGVLWSTGESRDESEPPPLRRLSDFDVFLDYVYVFPLVSTVPRCLCDTVIVAHRRVLLRTCV